MNLRLALYELSGRHGLGADAAQRLAELAGLQRIPDQLVEHVARGVAVLAAALGGFGLIVWLAANWDTLGRISRFALLQGGVLSMSLGAWLRPAWRVPFSMLALLSTGGLLAHFGQTYQTGADPWQLFAVWAVLTLPLCLSARSDITWTPWALVVMTAFSLWVYANTGHSWRVEHTDVSVHLAAWVGALGLCGALSPGLARWTGAGIWAFRLGLTLAAITLTATALGSLLSRDSNLLYMLGLMMLGATTALLSQARFFDVFALSVAALGVNVLMVFGLGYALLSNTSTDWLWALFLLVLCAAGLLAGTVSLVLHCNRQHAAARGVGA